MTIKSNEIKSEKIPGAVEEILALHPGIGFETAEIAATHLITIDEDWSDEPDQPETPKNSELKTLDDLLAQIKSDALDDLDWSSLPTFGGEEPADTVKIWSWDETRLLVGTCADDMKIIDRPKKDNEIIDPRD
jgi:hypothetical protein